MRPVREILVDLFWVVLVITIIRISGSNELHKTLKEKGRKKMLKTGLKFVFAVSLIFGLYVNLCVAEEQITTGTCVTGRSLSDGYLGGIVISPIITQRDDGKKWCAVYTANGEKTAWVAELKEHPCSIVLEDYSEKQKEKIAEWFDAGANYWLRNI